MASSQNVEMEAAKFLHKLIQESKDEPAKLATKLYVILQHMKSSGKEHSMPYQVISRAMETVINQHGLDIEALKLSRIPLTGGNQIGDSASAQFPGSSQAGGVAKDSKVGLAESEVSKVDPYASNRPPVGQSSSGHDYYQGSVAHRSSQSFDHESPSSLDSRSANSQSQERQQRDGKKATAKRKRGDTSLPVEQHDNTQQLDTRNAVVNPRKGKMNKVEPLASLSVKGGERTNFNMAPSSGQMEHFSSLSGSMRSALRTKQEGQHMIEKQLDSANMSNSMLRAPNPKYPEEVEVSSASGQQQGGSLPSHDIRGGWNQNKTGLPFEKSQVPRFSSNVVSGNMMAEISAQQSTAPSLGSSAFGKVQGGMAIAPSSYPVVESGFSIPMRFSGSLEHEGGSSNMLVDANKTGRQSNVSEMSMLRNAAPRDTGKAPIPHAPTASGMPFKEQQLKQLRAQCLVFLAFRNGLLPKKLHLEIALGNIFPKEGGNTDGPRKELSDHKGKVQSSNDPSSSPDAMMPFVRPNTVRETDILPPVASSTRRLMEADTFPREAGSLKMTEDKNGLTSDISVLAEGKKHLLAARKPEAETQTQEIAASQACLTMAPQQPGSLNTRGALAVSNPVEDVENSHLQVGRVNQASSVMGRNKQMNPEIISWTGIGGHSEVSRGPILASSLQHELLPERKDSNYSQFQNLSNSSGPGNQYADSQSSSFTLKEQWKTISGVDNDHHTAIPMKDANVMSKRVSQEQEEEDRSVSTDSPPSPKYTMSEKWLMDQQKKKFLVEQSWVQKQQKTKQRIATCFDKLKENVSSSEDISAKTKSVIELKKLQLLDLQRRLRSDFLNDFFKPITTEMDRLKSFKKHRHGRRIKQVEKFEQKMKEERQKRIRERQKEFFSEIEVHKERLDDVFKIKRERWKGFNKYVKEFHKRKERIHREKIDRIQREKINLLKINDVEGYLRMVQDAKSDRVKQLLKETEKYLQKLGSKLQEAKTTAGRFGHDMDEIGTESVIEKSETTVDNEDESDQAKHYMESNEKYYLMAHSIKENIAEQPFSLQGGKLREYQMNGLRWLVSLYNNHLNGILADEMGLGKTVQVIALMCYLMETKNDRGPFLVVVPSSVLPGWESEISFWAPGVHKIVYAGPPEERRRLFKEKIVHRKFNVLLTTYEYLMNKHDRPKLSKVHWHYIIIDEGHRIKNASCKLNADLRHYQSSHRLLLTGTPLQNNLEELWALLNFLLPNIFNSSEDFSQWFNKPFQSNGDNSQDEALLSEEENLLIINRLHQVLRPFVLRRLKHKVENQLPEKIERLIRCEASAYQKLLMKRVEENLGSIGASKARTVHNSVMELRNICNHPYLSQIHAEEVDRLIPKHYLPPIIRLCGKLEMLDRLLPKLKATDHRVLFFSTMTRLLDVMEEYLNWKQYRYLRLDGHTSGGDRGALIDMFNQQVSPYFIFLLSIRAGGVGVNLQAADTVIIFDTDWNPQVDLQAQARAHRIGQKRDVLVLRFETVQTVEEQVRAAAEHKLGVANQSITAGFFDNNTSAEDRREYLESLLRESKKEEAAPVLDDDALNDLIARSESEIDVFESVDKQRQEKEMATWKSLCEQEMDGLDPVPPPHSRLVTDDDLKEFYEAMKIFEVPRAGVVSNVGIKRKGEYLGGLDTQHYGRGKRAREVRSYEEQWTEEEFEKICQVDSPESPKPKEEVIEAKLPIDADRSMEAIVKTELPAPIPLPPPLPSVEPPPLQQSKEITPPSRRGRGRPKRATSDKLPASTVPLASPEPGKLTNITSGPDSINVKVSSETVHHTGAGIAPSSQPAIIIPSIMPGSELTVASPSVSIQVKGQGRKTQSGVEAPRRRGKKQGLVSPAVPGLVAPDLKINEQAQSKPMNPSGSEAIAMSGSISDIPTAHTPDCLPGSAALKCITGADQHSGVGIAVNSQSTHPFPSVSPVSESSPPCPSVPMEIKGQSRKTQSGVGAPRRRGRKPATASLAVPNVLAGQNLKPSTNSLDKSGDSEQSKKENNAQEMTNIVQEQACHAPDGVPGQGKESTELSDDLARSKQIITSPSTMQESASRSPGAALGQCQNTDVCEKQSVTMEVSSENVSLKTKISELPRSEGGVVPCEPVLSQTVIEVIKNHSSEDGSHPIVSSSNAATPVFGRPADSFPVSPTMEGVSKTLPNVAAKIAPSSQSALSYSSVAPVSQSIPSCPSEPMQVKRQVRKTPARVEAPRRRGRKQTPLVPAIPDGSATQDPKSSLQSQNRSGDSLGTKAISLRSKQGTDSQELMNVIQAQACEVQSPGGLAGHDPKRKERSANAGQNKQTKLDIGAGTSDKIPLLGRIQTADVNDVARVMKEVFSGTVPSKTRVLESFGSEGRDASKLAVSSKILVEMAKIHSPEDKACSAMPTMETAARAFVEKQPETKADAKVEDANAPVMSETLVPLTNEGKPQSNSVAGTVQKIEDSGQLSNENSTTPSIMESICASSLTAGQKDVDHCQRAPPDGDLAGFIRGASSDQVDSSLACPGEVEPPIGVSDNSGNKSNSSLKESPSSSPVDPSGLVCPTISTKTNDAGDNPETISSVPTNPDDPDMVKSPGMTESGSGNKMEAFVKVHMRSSNEFNSPEGLRVSTKSDDVGDHLTVTSHIPAAPDHTGSEVAPDVVETQNNSGKKTECAEKESPDIYNFSGSVSDNLDMASAEAKATECSSEAVVEGLETSQKDIDLGAVLGPADTVRGYSTVTSDETPSDKGQWDAQQSGSKAQGEPRLETVRSVVPESTNAELVPKDHVGQLPPEMPSSVGDCVEVCNMEVDPSEGLSEKDPVGSTVPLDVLECPEAEMGDGIDTSQVGGVLPEGNMSENIDLPLSSIVREEKEGDTSNMGPVSSSVALEDSKRSEAEADDQMNVTQICGIVPENISEDMDLPQCLSATEVENIEGFSEKGPVGSIVAMQGSKSSKSEMDDQMDASQVHKLVAVDASEKVGLPVCSSATKSENVEDSSKKSAVDSSEAVNESKGSEAEEGNRIDVSQHSLLMPKSISEAVVRPSSSLAKEDKKIEDLLVKVPVTSSVPREETKGSEVEMGDQMDELQTGLIAPENTVLDLPSSSLGTEEEGTEVFLEKGPVSSLAPLEESICSEAEMDDRINVSQVVGILPLENKSENIDMPSSSIMVEKRSEDSNVGPVGSSVAVEESKGCKAEMDDGMTVSQVPGNASENMDLAQCSSATEGENIEGLSEKGPVGSFVAVEESNDQVNVSHDCGVVREENISEDIHMPSSSIGTEEEKLEDSSVPEENMSEDILIPSSSIGTEEEKVEDSSVREENMSEDILIPSSSIGTEEEKVEDYSVREENISEDIHIPSSSIGTEEEKVEDSSVREENISEDIHIPSSSIGTEEEKVEDSSVREENLSEDIQLPSSSIATEEEKVEHSNISPVASSVTLEESKGSEAQVCETVPENVSKTLDLPARPSATEGENIEGLSEKGPIGSLVATEKSNDSKPEISDQMDASQTPGSSATESENVEDLSEKGAVARSEAVDESNGSQAERV